MSFIQQRLIYEDDDLIVVDKPSGILSQATLDAKRPHMAREIENYLSEKHPVTEVYVGQHHRLDLETSGVMVFTKSKRANQGLAEQFRNHTAQKTYLAIVSPRVSQVEWIVRNYLAATKDQKTRMQSVRSGGDVAETFFRALNSDSPRASIVEARPRTGRRHQIRVHLAEHGHPIFGDADYGSNEKAPRVMLHAKSLSIVHPITQKKLLLNSPLPEDFLDQAKSLGLAVDA
jgi:RluA family pseudouridine synthase